MHREVEDVNLVRVLRRLGWMRGDTEAESASAHLPYLPNKLIVVNKTSLVNKSLAICLRAARAYPGYLVFNIADRRRPAGLYGEGARIGRQLYANVHCRTLGRHIRAKASS